MRSARFCALLLPLLLPALTHAASFDCKLAKSPREHAVCSDPKLSAADSELATAYSRLRTQLSPSATAAVQQDQRDWLRYLDQACPAHGKGSRADIASCLTDEYSTRTNDLKAGPHLPSGHLVYMRDHFAVKPNHEPETTFNQNPGFGVARFAWPQADQPSPAEASWNTAMAAQVLKISSSSDCPHPTSLDQCFDPEAQVDVSASIDATNQHFLISSFEAFSYSYGGAHPMTSDFTINFSLDAARLVDASSLFSENTDWKGKLLPRAIVKLKANQDERDMLWKGGELQSGALSGLTNPAEWTLSAKGLTITYGQYEVAAYAGGMPSIEFTWAELQPLLAASFNPKNLAGLKSYRHPES